MVTTGVTPDTNKIDVVGAIVVALAMVGATCLVACKPWKTKFAPDALSAAS